MDTTKFNPGQMNTLRRVFKLFNHLMIFMWRIGMGRMINCWPGGFGRIMVIQHIGRRSGRMCLAPVNYAPLEGGIYCAAAFGAGSDWYRNVMAHPQVELWLPDGKIPARAEDISDSPRRLYLLRQVIIASGFAGPLFGVGPKITDEKLAAIASEYRLIHFIREKQHALPGE